MSYTDRTASLLSRMRQAAVDANLLVEGADKADFLKNIMLNRSVGMSLLMASEIAAQIMRVDPAFVAEHPDFPWSAMRGMRNRIAHNYFDIDLERIWDTAINDVPNLIEALDAITNWRAQGE
ncbi:DUF86 domain-containing protein [Neorhizobium lilium]|uniref:DUF86 domain-containing protein n=1 Tax=Neorhizobium lilium TaxID=2503024 RepID=A0A3S3SZX6_9HYPH|nr:HepT-like ribonuclease domain-containing protein [Neorhizobium lilium]RWX78731.1 DUF86 domain-containing protein [Neorhizobium lilium]